MEIGPILKRKKKRKNPAEAVWPKESQSVANISWFDFFLLGLDLVQSKVLFLMLRMYRDLLGLF